MKTLTRQDLSDALTRSCALTSKEAQRFVEDMFETISPNLEETRQVKLSSFGTFEVQHKGPRMGRSPKKGIEVPIPALKRVGFNASQTLRNRVKDAPPSKKR